MVLKILWSARPADDLPRQFCSIRERSFGISFINGTLTQPDRTSTTRRVYHNVGVDDESSSNPDQLSQNGVGLKRRRAEGWPNLAYWLGGPNKAWRGWVMAKMSNSQTFLDLAFFMHDLIYFRPPPPQLAMAESSCHPRFVHGKCISSQSC